MAKVVLSVHALVDYALRTGDIDTRVFNLETMTKGSQLHAYYQAKQNEHYLAEQYLEQNFIYGSHDIVLQGRVDGIIINDNQVTIEEIKTTNTDLEKFFDQNETWHLGQAQCYALMYVLKHPRETIKIQLTYISQKDDSKMIKSYEFNVHELEVAINSFFAIYFSLYDRVNEYYTKRQEALTHLSFPFNKVRESQQIMMDEVSESLNGHTKMYFNAPTGSGKTMATLYPSIKYMAENPKTRIFYLTAKGSGKVQAEKALKLLAKQISLKSITLNAKEKMCANDRIACNPDECIFAQNFYGKEKAAIFELYEKHNEFTPEVVMNTAVKHEICPFEFQLDMSLFADVIIADYNYLFDPFVYLQRFFDNKQGEYIVLIDEAHNLPRRVMDNYSKVLDFSVFYSFKHLLKGPEHKTVRGLINKMVKVINTHSEMMNPGFETINEFPTELLALLEQFLITGSEYMKEQGAALVEGFADFFFSVSKFLKLLMLKNNDFVLYTEMDEDHLFFPKFHLKCLNPMQFINQALKGVEHAFFFSATLAPEKYYQTMLGMDSNITYVPSPFHKEQLALLIDNSVSLYFKDRDASMGEVVAKIKAAISVKKGNYIVYVPSFYYLEKIKEKLAYEDNLTLLFQTPSMNDSQKEQFINSFVNNPPQTCLGLAVLGGSFSEGVDLVSDRLSGIIILGVGYPPPSFEKELEKDYYDRYLGEGKMYAYVYPSLNKILQTMGRVIRTETDRGFILLLDKRYTHSMYHDELEKYNALLYKVVSEKQIYNLLSSFLYS